MAESEVERIAAVIMSLDSDSLPDFYERMLKGGGDKPHFGDCTNMPITCDRCLYEEFTAKARKIIDAIDAIRQDNPNET